MVHWLDMVILLVQYVLIALCIGILLYSIPARRPGQMLYERIWGWKRAEPSDRLLRLLKLNRKELLQSERAILLAGCGFDISILTYSVLRLILLMISWTVLGVIMILMSYRMLASNMLIIGIILAMITAIVLLLWDQTMLKFYREARAVAITREIYAISHQLLYFEDSSLHIHNKLRRCLPYSKLLRKDMEMLLAEWYQDSSKALQHFKERIGTAEGISFVETIDALRQQHNQGFYELLRTHLKDYKERLELAKESRKETSSYVLFVIAGIPILYTFQVFLYPWVQEVNKLMSMLNN